MDTVAEKMNEAASFNMDAGSYLYDQFSSSEGLVEALQRAAVKEGYEENMAGVAQMLETTLPTIMTQSFENSWRAVETQQYAGYNAGAGLEVMQHSTIMSQNPETILESAGAQVIPLDADTTQITAKLNAEESRELTIPVGGMTDQLHADIWSEDGQTLLEQVNGDVTQLDAAIQADRKSVV